MTTLWSLTDDTAEDDIDIEQCLARNKAQLIPLHHRHILRVQGQDAEAFLQGQCTCDVTLLRNDQHLLGTHCNNKGRIHSSFQVAALHPYEGSAEQSLGLRLHQSCSEHALSQLKKYAMFSKVTLTLDDDIMPLAVFIPDGAENALSAFGFATLPEPGQSAIHMIDNASLTVLRHSQKRAEIWVPIHILETLKNDLKEAFEHAPESLWEMLQIEAGVAEIQALTIDSFLPQELNYHCVDGIAFDKGCYTGQEVVARLHYRGQLKKHLYRVALHQQQTPLPGDAIYDDKNKKVAQFINTCRINPETVQALVVISDHLVQSEHDLFWQDTALKIRWLDLPYAIT